MLPKKTPPLKLTNDTPLSPSKNMKSINSAKLLSIASPNGQQALKKNDFTAIKSPVSVRKAATEESKKETPKQQGQFLDKPSARIMQVKKADPFASKSKMKT